MRALFLDLNAVSSPGRLDSLWGTAPGANPARDVFLSSLEPEAIVRVNEVIRQVKARTGARPVLVIASHWLHVWSLHEVAAMLLEAGLDTVLFSGAKPEHGTAPTSGVASWLQTHAAKVEAWAAIESDEVWCDPQRTVCATLFTDVRRAVALLCNEVS